MAADKTAPSDECSSATQDTGGAVAFLREYRDAAERRDLKATLGAYAPDAVLLQPGGTTIRGLAAIQTEYEKYFREFHLAGAVDVRATTCQSGRLAAQYGTSSFAERRAGGETIAFRLHFIILMRRGEGGPWKIIAYMWNDAQSEPNPSK